MKTKDKTLRTFSNSTFESSQKANVIHRVKGSYFLKLYTMLEESAVKVCVRVRPLIEREETAAESAEPVKLYWKTDKKTIHQVDDGNLTKNFSFDRVFSAEETTLQLYQELAKPLVVSTVEGYNGTIFAYGQTSSGKTFTMMGSSLTPGVIPLAMEDVFQTIKNCPKKEFLLRVSYLEIYNETVTDLLCDSWKRKPLEIREGNNKNVYVADLTEELVTSPEQALAWIRKGEKNRHYGKTKMNQRSSRSHTIFRMILENRDRGDSASGENPDSAIIVSHLNLVDLAGAERASQTGAEGTRFKEGCNINRSLFTLGQVIKKLSDETQKGFTNYRDSKLTRILQNSLGGNAKTVIICTITPVTLEETLSTLQFASAAKNMKNDPHVTEVSDDGALLRRYRNEIVDLKRRLHEVSSVTQTTATEKETLSQILQEKDQLQREQEDRIKNLTKLLVTSSNFVTIKKMPKRRVTWGGKLPSPAFHHAGESDLSFAEPFFKKRKADMSVLTEQNEDGDEFDSTFDMEMNQSNLTVRGFAESEFLSPNQLNKLSEKVSCLELQLENETQQKQEAMEEVETFQRRVAELEKQLEGKSLMPADAQLEKETQQNQEDMEEVETFQRRVAELEKQLEGKSLIPVDAQLEKETQQNQEDMEEVETFEIRVAELEKQLEKSQMPADAQEQMKRGFEETIQLCETLVSEKEMVATERDYLKQELNILMEQTENLKKEKAALLQEMEEKKEMDEFNSLEEESKREYEKELLNDISSLKKAMEASGRKSQELEANLVAMSEELKKKGDWAEELQRSSDVDLVQQVKQLRRSLDDAEGLSRDTKKEWAHLRSENISLKERAVTLTAGYERMEAQVNGLRHQLETEKSSFKKMQVDLQRELQGAFEENTKLTTLLDGKVPKNLIDSIELEKTVADLKKELDKSHEDERTLQAKIEDLSALQDLPDKVNSLMMQVCDLTEELCAVQKERDMLVSAKACSEEEAHQFRELAQSSQEQLVKLQDDLSKAELRENDLTQQCTDITEQLETLHKDLARSSVENSQLLTTVEESSLRLKENEQHRASIEDQLCGMQQVMKELEEKLAESESSKERYDNLSQEHQDQIRQLSEEVIQVQAELKRQQHLNSEQQSCAQQDDQHQLQIQELRAALEAMTEERSQLNSDLQQNMEMAAESQGLLHSIQEELRQQRQVNSDLESQSLQKETLLEQQMRQLSDALESGEAERERLLFQKTDSPQNHAEELEKLLSTVTSLTGERDQLQEILEGIREERNQLKRDLEDNVEMIGNQEELRVALEKMHHQEENMKPMETANLEELQSQLKEELESVRAERERFLSEKTDGSQNHAEELAKLLSTVTSLTGERDQLQEILEGIREERNQLKRDLEDNVEMMIENQEELRVALEKIHHQEENMKPMETANLEELQSQLKEELESVRAERERFLSEKTDGSQNHAEELEKLLSTVTSLTGERDQLQEILEGIREERNQLKRDLEDNVEMSIKVQEELKQQQHLNSEQQTEREHQEAQLQQQLQQLGEELETMTQERCQLKGDLQENLEMAAETQGLLRSIQEELRQQRQVNSDLESQSLQKESLLEQQAKQLNEELESVRAERERLLSEKADGSQNHAEELEKLLSTVTSLTEERDQLQEILEGIREERNQLKRNLEDNVQMMQQLEKEGIHMRDERAQIQRDLQENMEMRTLEQQHLNSQQQAESEQQMKQLEEECKGFKEGQFHLKGEADTSHKMLSDANATISILTEQINNLEQSTSCCSTRAGEGLCSRLEASMQKLQVSLVRLQLVIDGASKPGHGPLVGVTQVEEVMILKLLPLLPKPTKKIYSNINRSTVQITNAVWDTKVLLKLCAKDYKTHVEALVQNDLAVFEERRLQDLLLCRAQAPSHSVKVVENDLLGVWDERLSELLDRREGYLQKMNSVLKKLEESLATHPAAVSEELRVRERSNEELNALCMVHSPDSAAVENFLVRELARRSVLAQANTLALQGLRDERCGLLKELGVVRAQADSQLKEERSKTSTLLQILERAPVKTEADLLRDNQQLALQRQQLDGEIKEMQMRVEQLEEDQIKAADSISNHKQATQLLQTELQDACAQVKDREGSIEILKEKLRETEVLAKRRTSPSALELEELKAKLLKMELEMTASSSKHQEELLRMTTVLNHKEDALRTLKETLRRSQQEGEQSFNEGPDLHARLITARGRMVQSNILLEKNKLEEELKRLQSKISELESLVSTQQGEITKWKARAIKLKENKRDVVDKPLSPSTPTKHRLPMNSEQFLNSPKRFLNSPKRLIDSPKKFLDSPKSKFFDVRPGSESMSINCPKQFFDNSNLGTIQDASASVDKKDEWWPLSPKQSDVCKQQ
ncbi:centromere-associated protein E isoform X8 [Salmo salar]|uniref:Centromere-associated protein E isoform X8 n=1 Tax=Salmo salar TaxID=8030 RepID=A0ABM3DJR5_SALSA|nr:centromere-associated protein E isoform X8 [Salmo salar]